MVCTYRQLVDGGGKMSQHSLSIIVHLNEGTTAGTHVPRDILAEVDPSDCDMERYPSAEMHQGQLLLHALAHTRHTSFYEKKLSTSARCIRVYFSRRRDGVLSRCSTLRTCASSC